MWTGCRVTRGTGFGVGHSVGHGQSTNDPAQMTQVFHATIDDASASYQIQVHLGHCSNHLFIFVVHAVFGNKHTGKLPAVVFTPRTLVVDGQTDKCDGSDKPVHDLRTAIACDTVHGWVRQFN